MHVGVVSLEPWDDVWRRNQHFAVRLVASGAADKVTFVEPPTTRGRATVRGAARGVSVVCPVLRVPKRAGGLVACGKMLSRGVLARVDVLWINDPTLGVHCLRTDRPALYDV